MILRDAALWGMVVIQKELENPWGNLETIGKLCIKGGLSTNMLAHRTDRKVEIGGTNWTIDDQKAELLSTKDFAAEFQPTIFS